ncbi:MAG: hypothetical protein GY725_00855 [bacterium]|nr:hypothetical protein [bacterium]
MLLSEELIAGGDVELVERCVKEAPLSAPWDLFVLVPLALAGRTSEVERLETSAARLHHRRLIRLDVLNNAWRDDDTTARRLDAILTACEIIAARGGELERIAHVVELFAEPEYRRHTGRPTTLDLSLRACALQKRCTGQELTLDAFWPDAPGDDDASVTRKAQGQRSDTENKRTAPAFLTPLVKLYDMRAQVLTGALAPDELNVQLQKEMEHLYREEHSFSRSGATMMRSRIAESFARLLVVPGIDRAALLGSTLAMCNSRNGASQSVNLQVLARFALDRTLHPAILQAVTGEVDAIRHARTGAREKLERLLHLARFVVPLSHGDAESIFNDAIEVSNDIDYEVFHQIALFEPLSQRAVGTMKGESRRRVARDYAIVTGDAAVRLSGYGEFPWKATARALSTLGVDMALAAAGRWGDCGLVENAVFLPPVLTAALDGDDVSPPHVVGLTPLLDDVGIELVELIAAKVKNRAWQGGPTSVAEEVARDEMLRFGRGRRPQVLKALDALSISGTRGRWLEHLARATEFHERSSGRIPTSSQPEEAPPGEAPPSALEADRFTSPDMPLCRFVEAAEIAAEVRRDHESAHASSGYASTSETLNRIRSGVAIGDRAAHLEALHAWQMMEMFDTDDAFMESNNVADAITACIDAWFGESPSIDAWCRNRLLRVIVDRLPGFCRWLAIGESRLPFLLEKTSASPQQVCTALIEGMERHAGVLEAQTVYALVGLTASFLDPREAAQLATRYVERLVERIPSAERDRWDLDDIPRSSERSIARLIYAFMGDVDVRMRWRAAHAVRQLVRLGESGIVAELMTLYGRDVEASFRVPEAPFYGLAARLWLVIALERVASESPSAMAEHGDALVDIACDENLPHVLLRALARSALQKLSASGVVTLDEETGAALETANVSPIPRRRARGSRHFFGLFGPADTAERRFNFDSMFTLPYWYSGALKAFSDLDETTFLDAAERWIVGRWGVEADVRSFDSERRSRRFSERTRSLSYNDNGSRPILERFQTYLEWHAMWCATGELMLSHPLVSAKPEDEWHTLESRLRKEGLTDPPLWLADVLSPLPLEGGLWNVPGGDLEPWVEAVGDAEFLAELGLASSESSLVVGSRHETYSYEFRADARVATALVSHKNAGALVRALQTIEDSHDYRILPDGDSLEIDSHPYKLVGWLAGNYRVPRLDEHDPLRFEARAIECKPSSKTAKALRVQFQYDGQAAWVTERSRQPVLRYEAWGNFSDLEERRRSDRSIRSRGYRLFIDREALSRFLGQRELDLIVEVEINRSNKGDGESWQYDKREKKAARFHRIYVFRRDGSIEAAEGRIGTWKAPRP